MMSILEPF